MAEKTWFLVVSRHIDGKVIPLDTMKFQVSEDAPDVPFDRMSWYFGSGEQVLQNIVNPDTIYLYFQKTSKHYDWQSQFRDTPMSLRLVDNDLNMLYEYISLPTKGTAKVGFWNNASNN